MEVWIIRGLIGFLFGIFGLFFRIIWINTRDNKMATDRVNANLARYKETVATDYTTKSELNRTTDKFETRFEKILDKLDRIEDKLDRKADK